MKYFLGTQIFSGNNGPVVRYFSTPDALCLFENVWIFFRLDLTLFGFQDRVRVGISLYYGNMSLTTFAIDLSKVPTAILQGVQKHWGERAATNGAHTIYY